MVEMVMLALLSRLLASVCVISALSLLVASAARADVTSSTISTANYPLGIDIDSSGNVWIGYADGPMVTKGVTVVPT